jgi:hypothetical protein
MPIWDNRSVPAPGGDGPLDGQHDVLLPPPYQPPIDPQTLDDAIRAAANAVTGGVADRVAGGLNRATGLTSAPDTGAAIDEEVARSAAARARSPYASAAGDVAGSAMIPGLGGEALAARLGGGIAARSLGYGLEGAAIGAGQGAGNTYSGKVPDYVQNALTGGTLGLATGGVMGSIFGGRAPVSRAATPSLGELRADKTARYDLLAANPTQYDASHLAQRADDLTDRFHTVDRYYERDSPSTFQALDEMRQPYQAAVAAGPSAVGMVDPAGIDFIRKGINKIPPSAERATDRESGRIVKRSLDDFVENPPPGAVLPGYAGAAGDAASQSTAARAANAAYKRATTSDAMRDNAERNAAANYSGLNLENNLRQQYRGLLRVDPKTGVSQAQRAGYSPEEINRFQEFVAGTDTPGRNALRWAAKTAGGGAGLGFLGAAATGGAFGTSSYDDPRWLGLPLAGLALRSAGNRLALHNVNSIDQMVRQRSPLFIERAANAGTQTPGAPLTAKTSRDALALELLRQQQLQPQE